MVTCERCGMKITEEESRNADEYGFTDLCEDCADVVIVYEDEDEE